MQSGAVLERPVERPRRPWWRRWLRRIGVTIVVLVVAATLFSLIYNAATARREPVPAGLTYVRTGDLTTHPRGARLYRYRR